MSAVLQEVGSNPKLLYRMTVQQYHRMIETGGLQDGAPYELLDGHVVRKIRSAGMEDPMTINPGHATGVSILVELNARLSKFGCYMRVQQPIGLPPFDEPEPDGAIVRGNLEDYSSKHPAARDVLCVIEVADASLGLDRGYKQKIYADSGIGMYIIENLRDRVVEIYTEPMKGKGRYGRSVTLGLKQSLVLPTARGKGLSVSVRKLLP